MRACGTVRCVYVYLARECLGKSRYKSVIGVTDLPRSPQWMDLRQLIWFSGPFADVINCAEFCYNRLRGLDSVGGGGANLPSPIDRASRH